MSMSLSGLASFRAYEPKMLSDRIDRLSVKVEESGGGDLQVVIDRMSDAIQAMSSVGRRQAS